MAAKPDIEHLEQLVAEGRHSDALEGYLKLLAQRPQDPLLRSRVQMLKEAQASSNDGFEAPLEAPGAAFVITQEEVADGYVLAGRYEDALVLLERLLVQRPNEKPIADRVERVRKLHAANPPLVEAPEATAPMGRPAPAPKPPKPPPANIIKAGTVTTPLRPAAGTPVTAGRMVRGPSSVAARPKPRAPDPVEAAAATLIMGHSDRGASMIITDEHLDKNAERTLRSAPPRTSTRSRAPVSDATMVSAPPVRDRSMTSEELPTMGHFSEADEFSSSSLATVVDLRKDVVEEVVNTLTDAPEGFAEERKKARQREEDALAFQEPTRVARDPSPPANSNGLRQSLSDRGRAESPTKKTDHAKK